MLPEWLSTTARPEALGRGREWQGKGKSVLSSAEEV